jgi:hypothetical protein
MWWHSRDNADRASPNGFRHIRIVARTRPGEHGITGAGVEAVPNRSAGAESVSRRSG